MKEQTMNLVKLPGTELFVNPAHVIYVEAKKPYTNGPNEGRQRVEVCTTMHGRYRTDDVFGMSAADVAQLLNAA